MINLYALYKRNKGRKTSCEKDNFYTVGITTTSEVMVKYKIESES